MARSLNVVFTGKPLVWYYGAVNAMAGSYAPRQRLRSYPLFIARDVVRPVLKYP